MLAAPDLASEIARFAQLGAQSATRHEFRTEALRRLRALIGFDSAVFCSRAPERPSGFNASAAQTASLLANFDAYVEDLRPLERAARAGGGVAVDLQVLSPRLRERLRFYREIVKPLGIQSLLAVYLRLAARDVGVIYCARTARPRFDERTCAVVRALVPILALGDAAHPGAPDRDDVQIDSPRVDPTLLTRRDRDLIDYVVLGLRNHDIATALSVSTHTVRNQLSALYVKAGVANRTELAHFATCAKLTRK